MRIVALDTETTGFSPTVGHRIIEIGCVEIENGQLTGREFHRRINPQRSIDPRACQVHGISDDELVFEPLFWQIEAELIEFLHGAQVIAHNASFDERFLDYELSLTSSPLMRISNICEIIDTLREAKARIKHLGQANLDDLCRHYNIDTSARDKHGALLDARLLAQMWLAMTDSRMS